MSNTPEQSAPYGTWPSPISAKMVASAGIDFGHVALDGETVYWREQRPKEDGRGVVVRYDGETREDVTPEGVNVRSLIHQTAAGTSRSTTTSSSSRITRISESTGNQGTETQ